MPHFYILVKQTSLSSLYFSAVLNISIAKPFLDYLKTFTFDIIEQPLLSIQITLKGIIKKIFLIEVYYKASEPGFPISITCTIWKNAFKKPTCLISATDMFTTCTLIEKLLKIVQTDKWLVFRYSLAQVYLICVKNDSYDKYIVNGYVALPSYTIHRSIQHNQPWVSDDMVNIPRTSVLNDFERLLEFFKVKIQAIVIKIILVKNAIFMFLKNVFNASLYCILHIYMFSSYTKHVTMVTTAIFS